MKKKISLLIVLVLCMSVFPAGTIFTAYADEDVPASEVPDDGSVFEDIIDGLDPTEDAFDFIDDESKYELLEEAENYPESFDLRDLGYVTPVRSQAPFGTCWGFAAIAAAESSILSSGLGGGYDVDTLNLSEKQLTYFSAKALDDPENSQNGEGQYAQDFISTNSLMNRGGNAVIAASVMAQGIGPQHEDYDRVLGYHGKKEIIEYSYINGSYQPYCYSEYDDWTIPESYRFSKSYLLREARILPAPAGRQENGLYEYNEAGTAAIKQELLNHRAVMVSFMADASLPGQESDNTQYISTEWAHYTCMPLGTSHMVTIVGWDDNYSKDNFLSGSIEAIGPDGELISFDRTPPFDGAWLVKNSWGSGEVEFPDMGTANWGIENDEGVNTGYFWLSYYDQTLLSAGSLVFEEADPDEEVIDQYDYMPMTSAMSYSSDEEMKMANIFWARSNEILEYVSTFTTAPETDVTIEIYLMPDYIQNPETGVMVARQSFHYAYGGYHKESLDDFEILFDTSGTGSDQIQIMKDQGYSIVVTQRGPDGSYLVNFQFGELSEGGVTSFKGVINASESWLLKDDWWDDYAYADNLREEIADSLLGSYTGYDYSLVSFDNFPIKGFCREADNNLSIIVSGDTDLVYQTRLDNRQIRANMYGGNLPDGGITDEDIVWGILNGGDQYIEFLEGSNPTRKFLKAIKAEEEHHWFPAYVTIKNVGTAVFSVGVGKNTFKEFIYDEESSLLDDQPVYLYTGEEITPIEDADAEVQPIVLGTDYELFYENNIKCGIASCSAVGLGGMFPEETILIRGFAIVPTKSEITALEAGEGTLTVTVKDQSEEEPDGYHIWYREEGTEEWQEADIAAPETTAVLSGLSAGKKYEVKAAGYVDNYPEDQYIIPVWNPRYYGIESDIAVSEEIEEGQNDGWIKTADGKWHYYSSGTAATGWKKIDGKWYLFNDAGEMLTGWQKSGGSWYYLKSSGAMATGWQKIGGTWYFLKSSGAMAANEWCEGYWLNANGSWTYQPKGSWHKDSKGWWFGDTSGWYARNTTQKIDGVNYRFNASGYWVK